MALILWQALSRIQQEVATGAMRRAGWRRLASLCHHPSVNPLKLIETGAGKYSLLLNAGTTDVDALVEELGHEPNGYFWEGVARLLVSTQAPALEGRFSYDPEAGMFCAYGQDRSALDELAARMAVVATDPDRLRELIALAAVNGFEFDD